MQSLLSILRGGFLGHYCREEFRYNRQMINIYVPMVAFCDIPLSHIPSVTYGGYGIGMSSIWGNAQKLTPICYFPKDDRCALTSFITNQANDFYVDLQKKGISKGACAAIVAYSKPRNKYTTKGHRADNYVEKEWRKAYLECSINPADHKQPHRKMLLRFAYNAIDFIIVPNNSSRDQLISHLTNFNQIGGNSILPSQLLSVISKIITIEEIKNNY